MTLLKQIAGEDPNNAEIEDLLREAQSQAEIQRVTRAIDQVCAQARELSAGHDYDAAGSSLRRALQTYPGDPRLEGLLDAVSRQKQEWESETRMREALRASSQLIREGRYPEAVHAIENFLERDPGEPALLKLLNQAKAEWEASKRSDALNRALAEIQAVVQQNRLNEAAALLEHHGREFGAAPAFLAVRGQVEEMARAADRARRLAEAETQIRNLMNQGNREAALTVCQAAMAQDPDAPQLLEWYSGIQQQLARDRRQSQVSKLTGLTRQAIVLKDWNTAAARLQELAQTHPDEPSIPILKDTLTAERRREDLEQALGALNEAIHRRDWPAAEKRLAAAQSLGAESPRIADARHRMERGRKRDRAVAEARTAHKKSRFDEVDRLLSPLVADDPADVEAGELPARRAIAAFGLGSRRDDGAGPQAGEGPGEGTAVRRRHAHAAGTDRRLRATLGPGGGTATAHDRLGTAEPGSGTGGKTQGGRRAGRTGRRHAVAGGVRGRARGAGASALGGDGDSRREGTVGAGVRWRKWNRWLPRAISKARARRWRKGYRRGRTTRLWARGGSDWRI